MATSNTAAMLLLRRREALSALRTLMAQRSLAAYLVPSEDAHQSEYVAEADQRRAFLSGFSGSAGHCVVTMSEAALWTDGRYFLQASEELDSSHWKLMKAGLADTPTREEWLAKHLPKGSQVGVDSRLLSYATAKTLRKALRKAGHSLVGLPENLVDLVWTHRPALPDTPVVVHAKQYAGMSVEDKLANLRKELQKEDVFGMVITALDEIAWLFNLRGSDILFNPVFFAFAIVTEKDSVLFIDERKLTEETRLHLSLTNTQIRPYEEIYSSTFMSNLAKDAADGKGLLIGRDCNLAIAETMGSVPFKNAVSPVCSMKAIKNETEIQGMRDCHVRDGSILCELFSWIERELETDGKKLSEVDISDHLEILRRRHEKYVGPSFESISAVGPNSAVIHYKPHRETCGTLSKSEIYLLDSGCQYLDGTTDVTRTLYFGTTPTEHQRRCYTLVLKGNIALEKVVFPKGVSGYQLDAMARMPLWREGLDYRHGTGHGVGSYLNVHEGPQGLGTRITLNDALLQANMTLTNEPGYYEDGSFGIRIENLMIIVPKQCSHNFGDVGFLGFDNITMVPLERKLIDLAMLTPLERKHIDDYHTECFQKVSPFFGKDSDAYKWLQRNTQPL